MPDLADLVTARLHGLLLTLELGEGHLQLLEVGVAILYRALTAHKVLHCLLEDLLGLGASLDLAGEGTDAGYVGLNSLCESDFRILEKVPGACARG